MRRGGEARLTAALGYRLLAGGVPFALLALYFLIVSFMPNGVIWPIHLWAGSVGMAAAAGVLLSLIILPARAS
jgi:hypothetical protein